MTAVLKRASGAGIALALVVLLTGCMTTDEAAAFDTMNADRARHGVPAVGVHGHLIDKAKSWAQHLANQSGGHCNGNTLVHSNLADGAPPGWRSLGENVGCRIAPGDFASHIGPLQTAFMNSTGHRNNILSRTWNVAGVGMAAVPAAGAPGWLAVYEVQEFGLV